MSHEEKLIEIYKCLGVEVFNKQSQQTEALKEIERLQALEERYSESINPFNEFVDKEDYDNDF